ncbi:MAG: LbtU family siderophore porin [Thermodesulfobacteriota bacterium]|nr:LbtU family siderophore porin [Thermodesulfobacteriota bacterium]
MKKLFVCAGVLVGFVLFVITHGVAQGAEMNSNNLNERVSRLEEKLDEGILEKLMEKFHISGVVELEAYYMLYNPDGNDDLNESDITLATVELGIDIDIHEYVKGHILFLWEEDDTEPVDIDEGTITLGAAEGIPFYLTAGKLYAPFGMFESHFISDPLTLEIGETRESAAVIGYTNDIVDISFSLFNGDINNEGRDEVLEHFVVSAIFTPPVHKLEGLQVFCGASYISNIADSDTLQEMIYDPNTDDTIHEVHDYVDGVGIFLCAEYKGSFFNAEYIGALEAFGVGEFGGPDYGPDYTLMALKPKTWNVELAHCLTENLKIAGKYEGSDDLGALFPETQYGIAISHNLFANTVISFEYLYGEFENNDNRNLFTTQLAIEF